MFVRRKRGFTLVELLVVVAIIGVLVGLLLPAVQRAREAARRSQCGENMRQLANAVNLYANSKGQLPASRTVVRDTTPSPPSPVPPGYYVVNWVCPLLAELEQGDLHRQIMRAGDLPDPNPGEPMPIKVLICPSQPDNRFASEDYPLSYVVNGGRANFTDTSITPPKVNFDWVENGVFIDKGDTTIIPPSTTPVETTGTKKHRIEEIAKYDGTSNTLLLSENANVGSWVYAQREHYAQMLWFPEGYQRAVAPDPPHDPDFDRPDPALAFGLNRSVRHQSLRTAWLATFDPEIRLGRPGSWHVGGFNVALCDGSVRWMAENLDYGVYAVLMTSRGERVNNPANSTFPTTGATPTWQLPAAANYPGTKFD